MTILQTRRNSLLDTDFNFSFDEMAKIFPCEIKTVNKHINPIKILVVEDTIICQKMAILMFKKPYYIIDIATSGHEAIKKYKENNYHIILSDLGLPDIDGLAVCRYIREQMGDKNIPIIAYSANILSKRECLDAGFSEIVLKPAEKNALDCLINRLIINSIK